MALVITWCLMVLFVCLLINLMYKNKKKSTLNLPPSFPSVPILGSLPFLGKADTIAMFFAEKMTQYGSVFSFMAGQRYIVVLNGQKEIREALVKKAQDFAARGRCVTQDLFNKEERGITFQDGEKVMKNRVHSMTMLKQFGFGERPIIEEVLNGVVTELIDYMKGKREDSWDPSQILEIHTLKTIYRLMFGKESGNDEMEKLQILLRNYQDSMDPVYDIFPLLVKVPPFKGRLEKECVEQEKLVTYYMNKIEKTLQQNNTGNNFVQEFVRNGSTDKKELAYILRDIFTAGTETVSFQVARALAVLGNRPNVAERLQKEIDSVVPRDRLPSLYDRKNMPYLEATILELFRYRTIFPITVPYMATCDTQVGAYDVRKDTTILVNLWAAHMDPLVWKDPENFRPERFLDDEMNIINQDLVIVFSLGKRACLGEVLARQETFLFLSAILQQFNILPAEGQTKIVEDIRAIKVVSPSPLSVRLVGR